MHQQSIQSVKLPKVLRPIPTKFNAGTTEVIRADKISSSAVKLELSHVLSMTTRLPKAQQGDVVVVRVLSENAAYGVLELEQGRQAKINTHDIIVGVLGARKALRGFVGTVPVELAQGDRLHLLNMGGVIGQCSGGSSALGKAIEVEFLGAVVDGTKVANIKRNAIPLTSKLQVQAPIVVIGGTCMNSGKTQVATELIKRFSRAGKRVAAAKLSGVACLKDTLNMRDCGAFKTLSFHDCGLPSTVDCNNLAPVAKALLNELDTFSPDVIIVELGDGIMGGYNVESILKDRELKAAISAFVFCASDFVGAWGGKQLLKSRDISIDVVSGACTDSSMGVEFIKERLDLPAANSINSGEELFAIVAAKVKSRIGDCA